MGFLRKLFGGDRRPARPATSGGRPASPPPPRTEPTSVAPIAPKRPQAMPPSDLPSGPRRLYLEYVGGASSKFYAVSLEEEAGDTWRVRFTFGRIGSSRAWDTRVEGAPWAKAITAYMALIDEKMGKGYEIRPWPAQLRLPDGSTLDPLEGGVQDPDPALFRAPRRGVLPPASGGSIKGISLPDGRLYAPQPEGGSRGEGPVIWASSAPVPNAGQVWRRLAAVFAETGIWPLIIDDTHGFKGFDDYLMDMPRGRHTEVAAILRRGWNDSVNFDEEYPDENVAPFGKQFPGLAERTPGQRPTSIDAIVAKLKGHLGLVAVNRPADVLDAVGWMGAVNNDGDPLNMSTVLRSWEVRFDAYLVGLGTDTMTLAVGRPARDLAAATAIAAEHLAFCPDNIEQGAGSIQEYAPALVNLQRWDFWWD